MINYNLTGSKFGTWFSNSNVKNHQVLVLLLLNWNNSNANTKKTSTQSSSWWWSTKEMSVLSTWMNPIMMMMMMSLLLHQKNAEILISMGPTRQAPATDYVVVWAKRNWVFYKLFFLVNLKSIPKCLSYFMLAKLPVRYSKHSL